MPPAHTQKRKGKREREKGDVSRCVRQRGEGGAGRRRGGMANNDERRTLEQCVELLGTGGDEDGLLTLDRVVLRRRESHRQDLPKRREKERKTAVNN